MNDAIKDPTATRTLVKARLLRRSLSTTLVDEDVRRLFRATKRARHTITRRVVRERAELELTPRPALLLAAVEAELDADLGARSDATLVAKARPPRDV